MTTETEPTDAEINEGIAKFCGWTNKGTFVEGDAPWWRSPDGCEYESVLSFTTSFDALREAIGKMSGQQQGKLLRALYDPCAGRGPAWLLCDMSARTLAEAVYQVVRGEK